jgi:hypothetical protein
MPCLEKENLGDGQPLLHIHQGHKMEPPPPPRCRYVGTRPSRFPSPTAWSASTGPMLPFSAHAHRCRQSLVGRRCVPVPHAPCPMPCPCPRWAGPGAVQCPASVGPWPPCLCVLNMVSTCLPVEPVCSHLPSSAAWL